jgi:NADPH-dependent 2,4-dienoyl-CoA reductase/sulfur reductase-like enzyme
VATTDPQIAVVGGGPAGLAAAAEAARAGLRVRLYDERAAPGGPVYRHAIEPTLLTELTAVDGRVVRHHGATVWGIFDERTLAWWEGDRVESARPDVLVLATGGRPRAVPIPGWTLPGVGGAGAPPTAAGEEAVRPGQRVLVAGVGPMLAVVAARLVRAGAEVVAVLDAAVLRGRPRLLAAPWDRWPVTGDATADWHTLRAARVRVQGSCAVARVVGEGAAGDGRVRGAVTVALDESWRPVPGSEARVDIAAVQFAWGSVPSIQLAQLSGAALRHVATAGGFVPIVSAEMETTAAGVFAAGGIAGAEGAAMAALEGRVAGIAAAARLGALTARAARSRMRPHQTALAALRRSRTALARLSAPRIGLAELISPETIVCPCEGVTGAQLAEALHEGAIDLGQVKRATRAGMGPCQGLACNPSMAMMLAWRRGVPLEAIAPASIRAPVTPVPIHALAALPDE